MRPGDLVGAITNEAGVRGNAVGAIQIADDFSLVEVPCVGRRHDHRGPVTGLDDADRIIAALSRGSIRGKKVPVRRER